MTFKEFLNEASSDFKVTDVVFGEDESIKGKGYTSDDADYAIYLTDKGYVVHDYNENSAEIFKSDKEAIEALEDYSGLTASVLDLKKLTKFKVSDLKKDIKF